jgi:hypothetical protein
MRTGVALESGTWADWANAAATTLAFTIALVLFLIGLRDRRRAYDDQLSAQARKVWVWPDDWEGTLEIDYAEPRLFQVHSARWRIENHSDDPITSCYVYLWGRGEGRDSTPPRPYDYPTVEVVRPGETVRGEIPYNELIPEGSPGPWVDLDFLDAGGVRWLRTGPGHLELKSRPQDRRYLDRIANKRRRIRHHAE